MKFFPWNANYWNTADDKSANDCVIRALCTTTAFGYYYICDRLGVKASLEDGFTGPGISAEQLEAFAKETGIVSLAWIDEEFEALLKGRLKHDLHVPSSDEMLKTWVDEGMVDISMDEYARRTGARFFRNRAVVSVRSNSATGRKSDLKLHATALIRRDGEWGMYDSRLCRDALNEIPRRLFVVNGQCPKGSPNYYWTEKARMERERKKVYAAGARSYSDKKHGKTDKT